MGRPAAHWKSGISINRTTPRREIELVAINPDFRGTEGLALAATMSINGAGMRRRVFSHDETPEGLAKALRDISEWISAGAP